MSDCSSHISYTFCRECGSLHIARTNLCRDRLCPLCAWRLSLQRIGELMQCLDVIYSRAGGPVAAAMLTLTVRNVPIEQLSATITGMFAGWDKLTRRRSVRAWVQGYGRSLEITKAADGTYHPHIHALLLWSPGYDYAISQRRWCELWKQSCKLSYTPIVDIRAAYSHDQGAESWQRVQAAAVEATKYALKGDTLAGVPDADLPAMAAAIAGRRLLSYGGILRTVRAELAMATEDSPTDVADMAIECPKCGSTDTILLAYTWAAGGVGYQLSGYPYDLV